MIAAVIVAALAALSLCAWVVILPPRERNGFEDYDLSENFRAAGGAAQDCGKGSGAGASGTAGVRSSATNRE